ncbi:unnamed protein product [Fusarium graminearum]|nr:unnamed protein product [Fusarium graminearum]
MRKTATLEGFDNKITRLSTQLIVHQAGTIMPSSEQPNSRQCSLPHIIAQGQCVQKDIG